VLSRSPGLFAGEVAAWLPLAMLGVFGPAVAATLVVAREGGWAAVRQLYAGLAAWRVPVRFYVIGLLLPAAALSGILWLLRLAGREGPILYFPDGAHLVAAVVVALGEEIGWRGFALPRLQQKLPEFAASGVIGVLWTLWHVPMFVAAGVPLSLLLVMALYFTGGSLLFTWLFNRSGASLVVVVVAHLGAHLNNSHRALPGDVIPLVVQAIVYAALGLLLMRPSVGGGDKRRGPPEPAKLWYVQPPWRLILER
jgi:membrane protease YdiL (CAAX protease family)